jgi:hypothetical protein
MPNITHHNVEVTVNLPGANPNGDPVSFYSFDIYIYAFVLFGLLAIGVYIRDKMCPTLCATTAPPRQQNQPPRQPPRQQYQPNNNPQYQGAPVTELMRLV